MGSGGKEEKMEDATVRRKGGGEEAAGGGGGGEGKLKEKEAGLFSEGDKVLAYHGPLIYEAKIQRAEFRKKEWKYYVHYLGWSKNWDEWVGTDRLMALTDTNLDIQKKLFKNQNVDKQSKGRLPQGRQKAPIEAKGEKEVGKTNSVPKGKKRKADSAVSEEKDSDETDHVMKIPMPAVLKKQLVDDWELIQSGKSIKLPRNPNVEDVLKKYRESKIKRENLDGDSLGEVLSGLQSYFNRALPAMLLYKQERAHHAAVVRDGSEPSQIYGAEHLLRLFVKLPELLVYTNMEDEALTQLQQKLVDFLNFLQKHQSSFFLTIYDGPKGGARTEPEEKKVKRDGGRVLEDRRDRRDILNPVEDKRDILNPVEDKRDKRVGTNPPEALRDKKDASKSTDDRKEKKVTSKVVVEEKRDRKDGQRPPEEKREKRDDPKAPEESKESRDGSTPFSPADKMDRKENSKSSEDKKEKSSGSKSLFEMKEIGDTPTPLDDKTDMGASKSVDETDAITSVDVLKEDAPKSVDGTKEDGHAFKPVDEMKEKDVLRPSDERKENDEDASVISI